MKRIILLSLCMVFFSASCRTCRDLTNADRVRIEQEVLSVHRQIVDAAEAADAEAMFSHILDNDGVIVQNGLFHRSREDALDYTKTGFGNIEKLDYQFDDEVVEILSWDKVLLKASGTSTAVTNDGRQFTTPFCQTAIYTLTPAGWKLLHAHHSTPTR
jgi:ketosteroid isomerase-like protein